MRKFITIPTSLISELPDDKRLALLDILLMADEKGEFCSTVRGLMNRWGWGSGKTVSFLNFLEERNIIGTKMEQKRNAKFIVNTELFGSLQNKNGTKTERKQSTKDENEKTKKKEDNLQMFNRLLPDYPLSETLSDKIREWIEYKVDRKETYVERGMNSLIKKISENAQKSGDFAVMDLIDMCMANNWKGIIWDKLEVKKASSQRSDINATKQSQLEYLLNSIREDEMNEYNGG